MCRLAFFPGDTVKHPFTAWFMEWLESRFGGHGNGVGFWVRGKSVIKKGVQKDAVTLAAAAKGPTVFHTRLASAGSIKDSNCHPFAVGKGIYCQNGTWGRWKQAASYLEAKGIGTFNGDVTDAVVLANIVEHFDKDFSQAVKGYFGVLLKLNKDGTCRVVTTAHGQFAVGELLDTGELIYASEFPSNYEYVKNVREFQNGSIAILSSTGVEFIKGGFKRRRKAPKKKADSGHQTVLPSFDEKRWGRLEFCSVCGSDRDLVVYCGETLCKGCRRYIIRTEVIE